MSDDFPCCKPLEPQRLWAIPEPQPTTDWQRLAVLQTEREHIGRKLVRAGNHAHTTPTPDVDRYYTLEKLIREGIDND